MRQEMETITQPVLAVSAPSASPAPLPARLEFIDGLRGLAMLMVLMYHGWTLLGEWQIPLPTGHPRLNAAGILQFGHIGVNLFLVISGFCLFWPFVGLHPRREPTMREFLHRRCRRILPPYYVALFFCACLLLGGALIDERLGDIPPILRGLAANIFLLQNMHPATITAINGPLWTVALEFQLYLLFPILFLCYRRFPASAVMLTVLAGCTLFRAYAYGLLAPHGSAGQDIVAGYCLAYSFLGRCFEFALGMFFAARLAESQTSGRKPFYRWEAIVFALIVIAALIEWRLHPGIHFLALTDAMYGVLFALLLAFAFRPASPLNRLFSQKWIAGLGFCSYSIYLVHFPLILLCSKFAAEHHFSNNLRLLFTLLGIWPLCILTGYLFHRLFERPFMQWRKGHVA